MNSAPRFRLVILGGGIAGLTAAYRASQLDSFQRSDGFRLFESSPRLGGALRTVERRGFLLEEGPDCFLTQKPQVLQLCAKLGIEDEILRTDDAHRRSFILRAGRLIPVPEGLYLMAPGAIMPLLRSPLLSFRGKLRTFLEPFRPRKKTSEDESLADFVRRRLGKEVLERIAQPMIGGIYTADPEKLSLRATMPQFLEMEKTHGSVIRALREKQRREKTAPEAAASGPRYSLFASFRRGMQTLSETLLKKIPAQNIELNKTARRLQKENQGWLVEFSDGSAILAEQVLIALPAPIAGQLLQSTDSALSSSLQSIPYGSVATVNFGFYQSQLGHPCDGMGFVVPEIENREILACTFSHRKFSKRAPAGMALLRVFVGGAKHPEKLERDDREIIQTCLRELRSILHIQGEPYLAHLARFPESMPQYHVGHLQKIEAIETRLKQHPGLHLAGNAYRGVGIPDTIASVSAVTDAVKPGEKK